MSKGNCFPSSYSTYGLSRVKTISFCTPKNISLWTSYCTIRNRSRNPLNSKIDLFMATVND